MKFRHLLACAAIAMCSLPSVFGAHAAETACPSLFVGGQAPNVLNRSMDNKARSLCFDTFSVLHSGLTRTPLYASEHLTAASVNAASGSSRTGIRFHEELAIPADERSYLSDYARSGYDRGHLANWADSADPASFTLANIVPQDPDNNRHLWEWIESATRQMARTYGEVYVVSGPIYSGASLQWLHGRVAVPSGLYKAVYVPALHQASVYVVTNAPHSDYRLESVAMLRSQIAIDVFPALTDSIKLKTGEALPPVRRRG